MEEPEIRLKIIIPIRIDDGAVKKRVMDSLLASVRPTVSSDVELAIEALDRGTPSIEGRADLALNQASVMEVAWRSQTEGFDGVFVSDMDMCGVEAARELLDIPIVGGFAANVVTAMMLGRKIGLVTISERVVPMQADHFRTYGIETNLAGIRVAEVSVAELIDNPASAIDLVYQRCCESVDLDGAEAIILGCTGFIGIAGPVAARLAGSGRPAPVLDPNGIAISYLELLVRHGLRQSRLAYPGPPAGQIPRFHF